VESTSTSYDPTHNAIGPIVLIVEPDAALCAKLVAALRARGLGALSTDRGREALAIVDRYHVEALVVDSDLPLMSGFDLAQAIRQQGRSASAVVLVITDVKWSAAQRAAAIQQMGLLEIMSKPLVPEEVAECIASALPPEILLQPDADWRETLISNSSESDRGPCSDDELETEPGNAALDVTDFDPSGGEWAVRTKVDPADAPGWAGLETAADQRRWQDEGSVLDEAASSASPAKPEPPRDPLPSAPPLVAVATEANAPPTAPEGAPFSQPDSVPGEHFADRAQRSERRQVERASRAAWSGPVELRGNLTSTPFPQLLSDLYQRRVTGGLFLLNGQIKKIVYFKKGQPTYIKSNRLSECLGKILVKEGCITETQCRDSLERMAATHRQQGTVLIEMQAISPHDLVLGLQIQLRCKLMDIFTWTRGEFLFKSDARVPAEVIRLDVSNAALIMDGVREAWDEERLRNALRPHMQSYLVPSPRPELRFQELPLEPDEQALLDSIDGSLTLREVLATATLPERRGAITAYVLLVTGVLEARDAPSDGVPSYPSARQPVSGTEDEVREQLAEQLVAMRGRDALAILGVTSSSSDAEVRLAYTDLVAEYHVDRYRRFSGDAQRLAQQIFELIHAAYQRVATAEQRVSYHPDTGEQQAEGAAEAGQSALQAEQLRRQAEALLVQESWREARQLLGAASKLRPEAADLRALLGWATYRSDPENASMVRSGMRELRRAVDLDPKEYRAYLFLGRIYASMGKTILAEKQFEKALQCNPDGTEALAELRIQKERRPPRRFRSPS
jgi:CheY-like chemotaxis protein